MLASGNLVFMSGGGADKAPQPADGKVEAQTCEGVCLRLSDRSHVTYYVRLLVESFHYAVRTAFSMP